MKRFIAMLLAAALLCGFTACGSATESKSSGEAGAESTAAAAATTTAAQTAAETSESSGSAAEAASSSISYPIEGDYSFTMTTIVRNNTSQALGDDSLDTTQGYQAIADATGVSIDFEMLPEATYQETMTLRIAATDYPDIFNQSVGTYDSNLQKAIEDDVLVNLLDYADYAPDWMKVVNGDQTYADSITNSDGSIAKMANKVLGNVTQEALIRGDWLDALNMDAPKNLDELTDVLKAFKSEYSTTNALLINSDLDSAAEYAFNFSAMGFKMLSFQLTEPGSDQVVAGLASDGYVNYLLYLHSLYEDGLITDDFLSTSKENGNWESSYYTGLCGVWQDDCKYADSAYAQFASDPNWDAVPFVYSDVDYHMVSVATAGLTTMYISTSCADPEIAMEFLNYGFTDEGGALVAFGTEGDTYQENSDGTLSYTDLITNNPDGLSYDQAVVLYLSSNWMPYKADERSLSINYTSDAIEAIDLWSSYGDGDMTFPTGATLTGDEMTRVAEISGDVLTLFSTAAPSVITGGMDEQGYRDVIQQAYDSMNLTEITQIYQDAYDRYQAAQ